MPNFALTSNYTYFNYEMHKIHSWFISFNIGQFQQRIDLERYSIARMSILSKESVYSLLFNNRKEGNKFYCDEIG